MPKAVLPVAVEYATNNIIEPIITGKCEQGKKGIDNIRKMVISLRKYFMVGVAEYIALLKPQYGPVIASCLGGILFIDVVYLLDAEPPSGVQLPIQYPMYVSLPSKDYVLDFHKWLKNTNEIPFIPVNVSEFVEYNKLINGKYADSLRVRVRSIRETTVGYKYLYAYPYSEDVIFRVGTRDVIRDNISIERVIEEMDKIRSMYPDNVQVKYEAVVFVNANLPSSEPPAFHYM